MNQAANSLRSQQANHRHQPEVVMRSSPLGRHDFSTASLDRRTLRQPQMDPLIGSQTEIIQAQAQRDSVSSGVSSASSSSNASPTAISRTTTFPVEYR